jgi:hypothetical protein
MVNELSGLLSEVSGDKAEFNIQLSKYTLSFRRKPKNSEQLALEKTPLFINAGNPLVAEVFSPEFFAVTCTPAKMDDSGKRGPGGVSVAGEPATVATSKLFDQFRLRGKVQDLSTGRSGGKFDGTTPATLAIVDDNIARKNTFDAHLVLGYAMPPVQFGNGETELTSIPFIQYDRDFVDGSKAPPNSSNVNNIAGGLQEILAVPLFKDALYAEIVFQPEYIWNLRNGAEITKLHLSAEPAPDFPYFGYPYPVGWGLKGTAYVRPVLNVGDVVKSTADPTLAKTNSFVQGGVQVGGAVFDNDQNSVLNGVSIPIEYTNLYGFSGQYKAIQLFTAAINYTLPKTKYITIGASYATGRNVDTFEQQQVYKVQFGVKY